MPEHVAPPALLWRDWALVAVLVLAALVEGLLRPDLPWRASAVLIAVGLAPTLLWRRTRPLLMVAIAFTVCGVSPLWTHDSSGLYVLAYLLLLVYALFRWGSGSAIGLGSAIVLAKLGLSTMLGWMRLGDALTGVLVLLAASALGTAVRYRANLRARELDQVTLLERERLARDLQDTVAHQVSAMAIRAQAGLATAAADPDAATQALHAIEAEASRTLTEMRGIVRMLRREELA